VGEWVLVTGLPDNRDTQGVGIEGQIMFARFLLASWLAVMAPVAPADWASAFIGAVSLPTGLRHGDTEVGGLSAIDFDPSDGSYLALSDDRSQFADARFYRLRIDLEDGRLEPGDVRFVDVTTLSDEGGRPFGRDTVDPEGLRLLPDGGFVWSSEGHAESGIGPAVLQSDAGGRVSRRFDLPDYYAPRNGQGIRHNLAFESLALSADGKSVYVAVENALAQDGPVADFEQGSPVRVLRLDLGAGRPTAEYVYLVGRVPGDGAGSPRRFRNSLVELLALDEDCFIALERSFVAGVGAGARLYRTCIGDATDVLGTSALNGASSQSDPAAPVAGVAGLVTMSKSLLFDLAELGIPLENLEGITFGPTLADGRRSLVLVSDNNFNPRRVTQFLAFALPPAAP
jgi:hypothetical protein